MTVKHFLFLIAAFGFQPVSAGREKPGVPYNTLLTTLATVQEEIVNVHNNFRRHVTPSARNMLKMSWSEDAAQNARTLTSQCNPVDSYPPDRQIGENFCGENMFFASYPMSWSSVIEMWYNESKYFTYGKWKRLGKKTDHYTQVVWAISYLIGCGVTLCGERRSNRYLYICHYCHEGNDYKKNKPYKDGLPCADCPDACEDRLCTNPCPYADAIIICKKKIKKLGCNDKLVGQYCKASCLCTTEIK
ncbi:cysteine-rich secretory protein 1 [Orycteropus afer afer]|uniref:Cysteine-rich secretory protein 1 n=1 Tax=Orycteropus afer afer TaxID=1230840 RepID=A0AC54Z8X9_ORYAF|nr:cysteine-rich secretory protein 1 [Orycteropus afer afer]